MQKDKILPDKNTWCWKWDWATEILGFGTALEVLTTAA